MRKLILQEWITLDGYAEDSNGKLDFFPDPELNKFADEDQLKFMDTIDTVLLGRKTYELFVDYWPNATTNKEVAADKINTLPKIVFSKTLRAAPWGKWPGAQVSKSNAVEEVKKLKQQQGKDIVIWGSISLAQSLIEANLIDEYHLSVCAVMCGGGRSLFPNNQQYTNFELVRFKQYDSSVMLLHYEPKI